MDFGNCYVGYVGLGCDDYNLECGKEEENYFVEFFDFELNNDQWD